MAIRVLLVSYPQTHFGDLFAKTFYCTCLSFLQVKILVVLEISFVQLCVLLMYKWEWSKVRFRLYNIN